MNSSNMIDVLVKSITYEADGISSWEFRKHDNGPLPRFEAGAHIDLHLSNDLVRSYSLSNAQRDSNRYVISINKDSASRGGSRFIHDSLKVGDTLKITPPRNHFPLDEDAAHTVFFAGGIGITPIWSMIQRLEDLGRSWELFYSSRSEQACAFRDLLSQMEAKSPGRVHFGKIADFALTITRIKRDAHIYCCGPNSMMEAFQAAAKRSAWPERQVHFEYFAAKDEASVEGGFVVELKRSGETLEIPPGKTILDALLDAGIDAPFSCMQGLCGTCEIQVLEGIPDHRDSVLSSAEQFANDRMMICCSGSRTPKLVLDL